MTSILILYHYSSTFHEVVTLHLNLFNFIFTCLVFRLHTYVYGRKWAATTITVEHLIDLGRQSAAYSACYLSLQIIYLEESTE